MFVSTQWNRAASSGPSDIEAFHQKWSKEIVAELHLQSPPRFVSFDIRTTQSLSSIHSLVRSFPAFIPQPCAEIYNIVQQFNVPVVEALRRSQAMQDMNTEYKELLEQLQQEKAQQEVRLQAVRDELKAGREQAEAYRKDTLDLVKIALQNQPQPPPPRDPVIIPPHGRSTADVFAEVAVASLPAVLPAICSVM